MTTTAIDFTTTGMVGQSLPNLEVSSEPFEIKEDVYMGDALASSSRSRRSTRRTKQRRSRRSSRTTRQRARGRRTQDRVDQIPAKAEGEKFYEPQSFKQYAEQRQQQGEDLDWTGFVGNSLANETFIGKVNRAAWSWYNSTYADEERQVELGIEDPMRLGYTKSEGRAMAMEIVDRNLKELGNVKLTDYKQVRQAKKLWNQKYELQYQNYLQDQFANSEMPTMREFYEQVKDNPTKLAKSFVQEVINKPELVFLPEIAAGRAAYTAGLAAKTLKAGQRTTQVAKIVAGTTGAAAGGGTIGYIDNLAQQAQEGRGSLDHVKALEQAKVDATIGAVLHLGGKVLTRGTSENMDYQADVDNSRKFAEELKSSTELNLDRAREKSKINEELADTATETYVDQNGNVYNFEIVNTETMDNLNYKLEQLEKSKKKYKDDKEAMAMIDLETKSAKEELKAAKAEARGEQEINDLNLKLEELKGSKRDQTEIDDIAQRWHLSTNREPKITQNYMKFSDSDGTEHTLRRLTPDLLKEGIVNVEGIVGQDLSGQFKATKAQNALGHWYSNYMVSATAPLRKLTKQSPTAKLLIDTLSPRDSNGKAGRAPVYTIQENTSFKQSEYASKLLEVKTLVDGVEGGEQQLMLHMRGVQESDNPIIQASADSTRKVLDDIREYMVDAGMEVDKTPNFLPRYYDRTKLETPESQKALVDSIMTVTKKDGTPKYKYEDVRASVRAIAENLDKVKDEARTNVEVEGDGFTFTSKTNETMPVGHRKWKDVPDQILNEYLDENFLATINRYVNNGVKRTEVDRVFGYNGSKLSGWLNQISRESDEAGRLMTQKEVEGIRDVYNLLQGSYGGEGKFKPAADGALAWQAFSKLPLVTLTSALEPSTILFKMHEGGALKALAKAYGGNKLKSLAGSKQPAQMRKEAMEMGLIHEAAVQERLEALVGEGLEGLPAKVNTKLMKAFGLHQWTEHSRAIAYEAANQDILKSIKGLMRNPDNKNAAGRRDFLTRMNISPDLAVDWMKNGANVEDKIYLSIKRGSARFANEMVANPNKLNKAKWLSSNSSALRMMGQFKSFTSTFSNEVAMSTIDEATKMWNRGNKVQAMNKIGGLLGVTSAMTYWAAYDSEGFKPKDTESERDVAVKMATGVASMVAPGAALVSPLYSGYDGVGNFAGPTAGDAVAVGTELNRLMSEGEINGSGLMKQLTPVYHKGVGKLAEELD